MKKFRAELKAFVAAALVLFVGHSAFAGDPKFEYKEIPDKPIVVEKPWVYKANASLGLTWASGNSQSLGFSGNGFFSVKHFQNQLELVAQGAYVSTGTSRYGSGGPITDTTTATQLWLGKGRYDRYLGERNTLFAAFQMSGDRPAGYWYRVEPQAGYSRLILKTVHQLLRGEAGYDYTFEHRSGILNPGDQRDHQFHSLRFFFFYENKFTRYAALSEGCELLWALNELQSVRVNSLTSLSSTIYKNVSLKLNFTVKFNNEPPARPPLTDPTTMMPVVLGNNTTLDKVDTLLEAVLAVTFL